MTYRAPRWLPWLALLVLAGCEPLYTPTDDMFPPDQMIDAMVDVELPDTGGDDARVEDAGPDAADVADASDVAVDGDVDAAVDAAPDGEVDAGSDAIVDAEPDGQTDATVDAEVDAEPDAEPDGQIDAEVDAAVDLDAEVEPDAADDPDATPDQGPLPDRSPPDAALPDAAPPILAFTAPADGARFTESPIEVRGRVSQPIDAVVVAGLPVVPAADGTFTVQVPLAEGPNPIRGEATRGALTAEAELSVTLDTTAPAVAITAPEDGAELAADQVEVRGTVDDPQARVTVAGAPARVAEGGFTATVALAPGPNVLEAVAIDRVGLQGRAEITVVRDVTAPVVRFTAPEDGVRLAADRVTLEGTVDDPLASLTLGGEPVPVQDGAFATERPLAEGENRFEARVEDPAGNVGAAALTVVVDTTAPALVVTTPADGATVAAEQVRVAGTVDDREATLTVAGVPTPISPAGTFSADVALNEEGNAFLVEAVDDLGNRTTVGLTVTRDTVAPVIAIDAPADGALVGGVEIEVAGPVDDPTASVTVNGVPAEVAAGRFSVRRPVELGVNRYVAEATDPVGNRARAEVSVIGDREGPGLVLDAPVEDTVFAAAIIDVSGRVADGAATVTVGGLPVEVVDGAFATRAALEEGPNTIVVEARDAVGNTERVERAVVRDTAPPALTIDAPLDGAVIDRREVEVRGTVEVGAELTVRVAGEVVDAVIDGDTWTIDARLDAGETTIDAEATDAVGNRARVEITVTVDDRPAAVVITAPADGTLTGEAQIEVRGRVDDPAVPVVVAGAAVAVAGDGTFTTTVDLDDGLNLVAAVAGASADGVRVYRDLEAPRAAIDGPLTAYGAQVDLVGRVIDRHAAVGDGGPLAVEVAGTPAEVVADRFVARGIRLQRGANSLSVTVTDGLGNTRNQTVDITRVERAGPRLDRAAGDDQRVAPGAATAPLTISAVNALGDPLADTPIRFTALDGGTLDAFPAGGESVVARTDAAGLARVGFTAPLRAGIHRVVARGDDAGIVLGEVQFAVEVTGGPAARIRVIDPSPTVPAGATVRFAVQVVDAADRPVSGAVVSFVGVEGVELDAEVLTDRHGRSRVQVQAGGPGTLVARAAVEGVEATAPLVAHVVDQDPARPTRIVGHVLDDRDVPLVGATVRVPVPDGPVLSTTVDIAGRFALEVPPGAVAVTVDASTALADGDWPVVTRRVLARPNFDTDLGPVGLPELSGADLPTGATCIGCAGATVRDTALPGQPVGALISTVYLDPVEAGARLCLPAVDSQYRRDLVTWSPDVEAFTLLGPALRAGALWCTVPDLGPTATGWHGLVATGRIDVCPADCADDDPCTRGACVDGRCVFTPVDDGPCGTGCGLGICDGGTCRVDAPSPDGTACDDGDACTAASSCLAGQCVAAEATDCDDADPCTDDRCDPELGCFNAPRAEGAACAADGVCAGTCFDGECRGAVCPAGDDPCQVPACADDGCGFVNAEDGAPCGDADQCGAHTCQAGVCTAAGAASDGQACDDADACTAGDVCTAGVCGGTVTPLTVDDDPLPRDLGRGIVALGDRFEVIIDRQPFLDVAFFEPARFDLERTRRDCCPDGGEGGTRYTTAGLRTGALIDGPLPGLTRTVEIEHRIDGAGARLTVEVTVTAATQLTVVGEVKVTEDGCTDQRCTDVVGRLASSGTMTAAARVTDCAELDAGRPVCDAVTVESAAIEPVFTGACTLALGDCDTVPEPCRVRIGPIVAPLYVDSDLGRTIGAATLYGGDL